MKFKDLKIGQRFRFGVEVQNGHQVIFIKTDERPGNVKCGYVNTVDTTGGKRIRSWTDPGILVYPID